MAATLQNNVLRGLVKLRFTRLQRRDFMLSLRLTAPALQRWKSADFRRVEKPTGFSTTRGLRCPVKLLFHKAL